MDKYTSNIVKGIAILFMLWLHLFNRMSNVELCETCFSIDGIPLVNILTRATNPVAFFLIISGYGMYCVNRQRDRNRIKRVITLLIHYWTVLLIFLVVGHILQPSVYPGSITELIENITTYRTTYNGEMWFLCPYIILALTAPLFCHILDRGGNILVIVLIVSYLLYIGQSWVLGRFSDIAERHYWIRDILNLLQLQFNFTLGAVAAKLNIFEWLKKRTAKYNHIQIICCIALMVLVWFQCRYGTAFYALVFIAVVNILRIPGFISKILQNLGRASMNIWLIHTWLCYYLFHDFIYGFKYPLLIFIVLLILSYTISLMVDVICEPIERQLKEKVKPAV